MQNQQWFAQPRLVITYPGFRYNPGMNSPPGSSKAGPPTTTRPTRFHCRPSRSARGISSVNVAEMWISSASSKSPGGPNLTPLSSGVARVLRGNTRSSFIISPVCDQSQWWELSSFNFLILSLSFPPCLRPSHQHRTYRHANNLPADKHHILLPDRRADVSQLK